jgi:hypothetical protein
MSTRPWIKQPTTKLNDARLHFVSIQAQRDYFMMYLLAGQLDQDGLFFENGRQLTDKEIAFRINTKPAALTSSIKELKREKLLHVNGKGPQIIDYPIEQVNWRDKQEADRERQQRHRVVTRDSDGVTSDGDDVTLPDQKKIKTRPEEDKKKTRPTPTPSVTSSTSGRMAGSKNKNKSASTSSTALKELKGKQAKRADQAMKILSSLGIRNPKLETTSIIVATRLYKNDEQMTNELLGAIASVYSDITAKSKEAVVLHRLETGKIPQSYIEDRKLWRSVPPKTLEVAGITLEQSALDKLIERGRMQ